VVACLACLAWAGGRRRPGGEEAAYLHGVAAELRGGASWRAALVAAADRAPALSLHRLVRLAAAGRPSDEVAGALAGALPRLGGPAAVAVRTTAATGGRVAAVFEGLALLALEEDDLRRERRAATAQARLSALVVGGLPLVYLAHRALTGRMVSPPGGGSAELALLVTGLVLIGLGLGAIGLLLRRAER
ncbi:MAG: type II secretion system F family protein, partial [Acidimicrobiia bacterium]